MSIFLQGVLSMYCGYGAAMIVYFLSHVSVAEFSIKKAYLDNRIALFGIGFLLGLLNLGLLLEGREILLSLKEVIGFSLAVGTQFGLGFIITLALIYRIPKDSRAVYDAKKDLGELSLHERDVMNIIAQK